MAALLAALGLPAYPGGIASARAELTLTCPETVPEGEPFFLRIETDETVEGLTLHWLDRELRPEYWWERGRTTAVVLLGVGMHERLAADSYTLRVEILTPDGKQRASRTIRRISKAYPEQHLQVDKRFSELSGKDLARHEREKEAVTKALGSVVAERRWRFPFLRPVDGEVTSDFGLRRFFNGEPKNPHSGVDLAAARGMRILACANGEVILTGEHFFAGNSVYIDHGQGVISMYFHLSEIGVTAGQQVARGEVIGRVGLTGRVTGPHLHWGVSILGQLVDPLLLIERTVK